MFETIIQILLHQSTLTMLYAGVRQVIQQVTSGLLSWVSVLSFVQALIRGQYNEERVGFRQEVTKQKEAMLQQRVDQLQQQEAEQQQRLADLRAQVCHV